MTAAVALGILTLLATSAAAVRLASRRRRAARRVQALGRRLAAHYPPVAAPQEAVPLTSPQGRVAIGTEGLVLGVGEGNVPLHEVPWAAIKEVVPAPGGAVAVRVSRVGEVLVPLALGRSLWERKAGPVPPAPAAPMERPRAGRV